MTRLAAAVPLLLFAALLQARECGGSGSARAARHPVTPSPAIPPTPEAPSVPPTPTAVPDLFATEIRPIVQAHCSPCHEPGGKMYARLPFDDPKVLSSHSEGVLRRLKGNDREAFERWLAALRPVS